MTQDSRPWDGISVGDAGPFSAAEWQQIWKYIIGADGARSNVGPFLGSGTQPDDGLKVQAKTVPNTQIEVLIGSALVQGIFYLNDATVSFTIAANASGNPRIDTVILRADYTAQTVRLFVLQGTPAASPTPPALTQSAGVTWEIPIADIAVANGFSTITNANITSRHEWANMSPGVFLDNVLNNSGGTLQTGDVVIWDVATNRAVTTTTTADDSKVAGVWVGRTANGGYGRVQTKGIGLVFTDTMATRSLLVTDTTAKRARALNPTYRTQGAYIGRALQTSGAAGLIYAEINVQRTEPLKIAVVQDQKTSGTAATSLTTGAWRTRDLNTIEVNIYSTVNSVASNQISLPPGGYIVIALAEGTNALNAGRLRIRDVTFGNTLCQGNNFNSGTSNPGMGVLVGWFYTTSTILIELQHFPNSTAAGGVAASTGEVEVYATVALIKVFE